MNVTLHPASHFSISFFLPSSSSSNIATIVAASTDFSLDYLKSLTPNLVIPIMADILKSPKSIISPVSSNSSSQKIMSSPPPMPSFNPSDDIFDASTGAFDSGTNASQPPPSTQKTRPQLSDIIDERYPSFDHQSAVVGPFTEEISRESNFQEGQDCSHFIYRSWTGYMRAPAYICTVCFHFTAY